MNLLLRKVIAANVFKKIKEGKTMYNYKINDESSAKVKEAYDNSVHQVVVMDIMSKINKLNSEFGLNDIKESLSDFNPNFIGKNIIISKPRAFTGNEIVKFANIDKEFSDNLDAITFELNSLKQQKQRAMSDFDISSAVRLTDKIMDLAVKIANEQAKINEYNNKIKDTELEFDVKYNNLISDIDNNDVKLVGSEKFAQHDKNVVEKYFWDKVYNILDDVLGNLSNEEKEKIFLNKELNDCFGKSVVALKKRYLEDVGADN